MIKKTPTDPTPSADLTPEPIGRLIQLFERHEEELRFPDVDAQSLTAGVAEVEAQAEEVDRIATLLGDAREELFKRQQRLLQRAQKAHAYANIYATGIPATDDDDSTTREGMLAELAEIKLSSEQRSGRKRKTKPATKTSSEALPSETAPPPGEGSETPASNGTDGSGTTSDASSAEVAAQKSSSSIKKEPPVEKVPSKKKGSKNESTRSGESPVAAE